MKKNQVKAPAKPSAAWAVLPFVAGLFYFLTVCLCGPATIKGTALWLIVLLIPAFICLFVYRDRLSAPLAALLLMCLMGGASTLYAVSGKFALHEFLKVFCALSLTLILLGFCRGKDPGRTIAQVLATYSAAAGLVSIDLISTRWVSGTVLGVLRWFTTDYDSVSGIEAGVRMTSLFDNANFFAGTIGLGVLLSLALVVSEAPGPRRMAHVCLLYINSLAFVLAFSMGASAAIAVAFVLYLVLEVPQRRSALLVLMVETLVLSGAAAALISATSFQKWDGARPVPLLCAILGAAALCLLDRFVGSAVAKKLKGKVLAIVAAAVFVVLAVYVLAAFRTTTGVTLHSGDKLRRAAYPAPGSYTLTYDVPAGAQSTGTVRVKVESQDQKETMMHTSTVLYNGALDAGVSFTVPEDSLVVYFTFSDKEGDALLDRVYFDGSAGSYDLPLRYPLLPGFIANRLQGLKANENAIQRLVFFSDGMKLFRRSPVVGLGMGAFENGIRSVQSFDYETKYAHNHYIQVLVETGVVGLVLFVGLLGVSAAAVVMARRKKDEEGTPACHPFIPALGGALVFMAIHAATEVVFSTFPYLPIAFGTFALIGLCCGGPLGVGFLGKKAEAACYAVLAVLMLFFWVLVLSNVWARNTVETNPTMDSLVSAATNDRFEWADYALSYVNSTMAAEGGVDKATQAQADKFAKRLAKVDSNTIPIYLSEYYFRSNRWKLGVAMIDKYVNYVSSRADAWQNAFLLLEQYEVDDPEYRQEVVRIGKMLDTWNEENMGTITLSEESQAFLARMAQ